jgi:hypothetical protein
MEPVELRIHGVGGSTPEGLLGERHPDDVVLVAEGRRTGLWARRREPTVQGYVWGGLTSGSKLQPLWVVLLPFTLVNVAGWMHPPVTGDQARRRQVRAIRLLVTAVGLTLTATWVTWLAVVFGDYLAYQAGAALTPLDGAVFAWALAAGGALLAAGAAWRWWPLLTLGGLTVAVAVALRTAGSAHVRGVGGVVAAQGVLALLAVIAGVSRRASEARTPAGISEPGGARGVRSDEDLRSPLFFARPAEGRRLLAAHVALAAAVTAALAWRAWARAGEGRATLGFGTLLVILGALQLVLVLALAVASLGEWDKRRRRWRFAGPAVAAGLGLSLTTGVFSGLALFVSERVGGVQSGAELALVDVFMLPLVVGAAVVVLAWLPYFLAVRQPPPAGRQRLARAFRHVDVVATTGTVAFIAAGLWATVTRVDAAGAGLLRPWDWAVSTEGQIAPLRAAATVALPFVVPALGMLVRLGARSVGARRNVGNLWDVLTFWPRRFHPFAVRPYSEQAVPELQDIVRGYAQTARRPVAVSAHSQGSVLAFAALSGMAGEDWVERVALVTYGSPLGRLHARFFPGYMGPDEFAFLRLRLFEWHNFFRRTDHIGQDVFGPDPLDEELPDPAPAPPAAPTAPPPLPPPDGRSHLEPLRTPGTIAGHNDYLRERRLQDEVAAVKRRLARTGALDTPPVGG